MMTSLICTLACSLPAYAEHTETFYCAPTTAIIFTPQTDSWAPYEYSTLPAMVKDGIQPALLGWGSADQAVQFESAVFTDRSLACNYKGLTKEQQSEMMVMVSEPVGSSPTCQFPTGHRDSCESNDPANCPMVCSDSR